MSDQPQPAQMQINPWRVAEWLIKASETLFTGSDGAGNVVLRREFGKVADSVDWKYGKDDVG